MNPLKRNKISEDFNDEEALVAIRPWAILPTGQISSFNGTLWPSMKPLKAVCKAGHSHAAPKFTCSCGMYCYKKEYGRDWVPPSEGSGETYIWGRISEHTLGYRVQFSYPKSIYLTNKALIKAVRKFYPGIEILSNAEDIYL